MAPRRSLQQAQKMAIEGQKDESQDSQLVLASLQRHSGIGLTSSSPTPEASIDSPKKPQTRHSTTNHREPIIASKESGQPAGTKTAVSNARKHHDIRSLLQAKASTASNPISGEPEELVSEREHQDTRDLQTTAAAALNSIAEDPGEIDLDAGPESASFLSLTDLGPLTNPVLAITATSNKPLVCNLQTAPSAAKPHKMSSSQSPTQANSGNRYEDYNQLTSHLSENFKSPAPAQGLQQISLDNAESQIENDDPDAVDFGLELLENPIEEESRTQSTSDRTPWRPYDTPMLKTPMLPKNKNPLGNIGPSELLGGTQLFQHGSEFSSVQKALSPTSSRPSPDNFGVNSISPNPVISSPLKTRGLRNSPTLEPISSPDLRRTYLADDSDLLDFEDSSARPNDVSSSRTEAKKAKGRQEQVENQGIAMSRTRSASDRTDENDVGDDSIERQHRAKRRKHQDPREDRSVLDKLDEVEVPSTHKKSRIMEIREPELELESPNDPNATRESSVDRETVADSQENLGMQQMPESDVLNSGQDSANEVIIMPSAPSESTSSLPRATRGKEKVVADSSADVHHEAIPETSPPGTRARDPYDVSNIESQPQQYKIASTKSDKQKGRPGSATSRRSTRGSNPIVKDTPPATWSGTSTDAADLSGRKPDQRPVPGSSPVLRASQRSRATRGKPKAPAETPVGPTILEDPPSSLSSLSKTPGLSNNSTPSRRTSVASGPLDEEQDGPASSATRRAQLPRLKTGKSPIKYGKASLKQRRGEPSSTDELSKALTPSPGGLDHSLRVSRNSRAGGRTSIRTQPGSREPSLRGAPIFKGMAFAISFQSKKSGERSDRFDERQVYAESITKHIQQAGGQILGAGFDELFDDNDHGLSTATSPSSQTQPDLADKLLPSAASTGFAALIADGHSRKAKYMQALALGLPCLAPQWVTACLDAEEIVDYSPYLLCAGQSSFLGDAIRSRSIQYHDPSRVRFSKMIFHRRLLLKNSRVLFVIRKNEESKRMAYVFLARALGATLSRATSIEDGRAKRKAAEEAGQPFDWIYADDKIDLSELFEDSGSKGKKRKRMSGYVVEPAAVASGSVRRLSDELLIQSLIMEQLIPAAEPESQPRD